MQKNTSHISIEFWITDTSLANLGFNQLKIFFCNFSITLLCSYSISPRIVLLVRTYCPFTLFQFVMINWYTIKWMVLKYLFLWIKHCVYLSRIKFISFSNFKWLPFHRSPGIISPVMDCLMIQTFNLSLKNKYISGCVCCLVCLLLV